GEVCRRPRPRPARTAGTTDRRAIGGRPGGFGPARAHWTLGFPAARGRRRAAAGPAGGKAVLAGAPADPARWDFPRRRWQRPRAVGSASELIAVIVRNSARLFRRTVINLHYN